jgi:hypothetical protein
MAEEEAAEFERHCARCPQCAAVRVRELFVSAMMRAARRVPPPEEV